MTRLCPEGEAIEIWREGGTPSDGSIPGDSDASWGFVWRGVSHRIVDVYNCWRIHTNWWQQGLPVSALSPLRGGTWREYLKVTTDSGLLCLLFCDLEAEQGTSAERRGSWYLARIYD